MKVSKNCYPYSPEKNFCIGEKARVIINHEKFIGTFISIGKKITKGMPEFELEDGRKVFGYECWWLPLDIAEKAEKEYK